MTHSYTVSGITCKGCVANIKSKLLQHPDITAADVTLEGQKATITMKRHLSVDELQNTIGRETKYKINENADDQRHHTMSSRETKSWIVTYKPLLLIFLFITTVSSISATSNGSLNSLLFMNHFMAGFFLVFSFFKILNLKGFAESYAMYDLLAKKVPAYGYVYPFIELILGLGYLINFDPFILNLITVIVMGFSSIGVIQSVLNKRQIRCACLGDVFNLPMSTITILEDLLMVAMGVILIL